jgi:hypothetical protein
VPTPLGPAISACGTNLKFSPVQHFRQLPRGKRKCAATRVHAVEGASPLVRSASASTFNNSSPASSIGTSRHLLPGHHGRSVL